MAVRSLPRFMQGDARPWAMLAIALAALAASFLATDALQARGLLLSSGLAGALGLGFVGWQVFLGRRRRHLLAAAAALIKHDEAVAFVTTSEGVVHSRNDAARERFRDPFVDTLGFVLTDIFANPGAVLFRLQSRAGAKGFAREDIVTRRGPVRLTVQKVAPDIYLWRLEENAERSGHARAAATLSLPMLTASPSGTVLYMNEAFRRVTGGRAKTLAAIFRDLPLESGRIHRVKSQDGDVQSLVAEVTGTGGRREIYLLPGDAASLRDCRTPWDAVEDLPVPLHKVTPGGEIEDANRSARTLLGASLPEPTRFSDLMDGLGRSVSDWLRDAAEGRSTGSPEVLHLANAAEDKFVQVTLNRGVEGGKVHLIAVLKDVTEYKSLERQFVQSQKMQAIGQLAGGVAHDFNNLLTAISGHCDLLLLRHDQGDPEYADLVQIHQNAYRAASLVGQLLAFSRKQNLRPETIDLRDALSDLTHLLNRLVGEKISLTLAHDPQLSKIRADKRQFEQVIMNLVVNARDAMPEGGAIRIETQNVALDQALMRDRATVPAGDYVCIRVIDEGHGIPEDKRSKIFEPFYTTKRVGEGTGLGLSTAYGIIKQTGGFIFADSEVGLGSTFSIYVPAYGLMDEVGDDEVIAPPAAPSDDGGADGVVLLVEDEAPVRAFASRALRLKGYTVLEAESAEAALDLLADPDVRIDLFVSDVVMPGMDGPSWVREALKERPDTHVVFVSGYAEDSLTESQAQIPNSVFLPKPFSLSELTQTVERQLARV